VGLRGGRSVLDAPGQVPRPGRGRWISSARQVVSRCGHLGERGGNLAPPFQAALPEAPRQREGALTYTTLRGQSVRLRSQFRRTPRPSTGRTPSRLPAQRLRQNIMRGDALPQVSDVISSARHLAYDRAEQRWHTSRWRIATGTRSSAASSWHQARGHPNALHLHHPRRRRPQATSRTPAARPTTNPT
jgi:hypothetical protein